MSRASRYTHWKEKERKRQAEREALNRFGLNEERRYTRSGAREAQ